MCGIAGFLWGSESGFGRDARETLGQMTDALTHRGPDSAGAWFNDAVGLGLGHRRLAIVDVSAAGNQPMTSANGRFVIVFNGEIYNHADLRETLRADGAGHKLCWRGLSDTETLLAGFQSWGVAETLRRANGMFALAVWDQETRVLALARDRIGEKPLYFGWAGKTLVFGSELKALAASQALKLQIDMAGLAEYVRLGYIPAPLSIFTGVSKVAPGTVVSIFSGDGKVVTETYWSLADVIESSKTNQFLGSPTQAVNELEDILLDAVGKQMMSDVPLGAFLSGGIDSSTVVSLMQRLSQSKVNTFSIGFSEPQYNEAGYAREVARHIGTAHTELIVTPADVVGEISCLPRVYDEPFADASQLPTLLVSRLARQSVTVSLSGDAGDELFGGYNRYGFTQSLWKSLQHIPPAMRQVASSVIKRASPDQWDAIMQVGARFLPKSAQFSLWGDKIHKGAGVMASRSLQELYIGLISQWSPASVLRNYRTSDRLLMPAYHFGGKNPAEEMMAVDMNTYLPDDILVKVDRAAMYHSLETRVPLLDPRVIEFAWRLPLNFKIREGVSKWVLRQVLYRHVPAHLIDRPKMGFGLPLDQWLRGPLRDWAESLLSSEALGQHGLFVEAAVRKKWDEHVSGARNWQYHLWTILMFQAWFNEYRASIRV